MHKNTGGYSAQYNNPNQSNYFKEEPNIQNNITLDNNLLEKINYMIHLLEQQKDEKTGSVAEELILYCFLGIFVIFVIDSFVKVGKYTR